jgi:outer membrane receptor protein involved in Fe transport
MRLTKVLTRSALALAFFIITGAVVYAAPGGTDEIRGAIKDALGRPLSGASLVLKSPDETILGKAQSDAGGYFVFSDVTPGTYAVLAEKPGFETGSAVVTVEAEIIATTTLTLTAQKALEMSVVAARLNQAQNALSPKTGGSQYRIDEKDIAALPQGANTPVNQVLLQAPGVANDSFGQLHIRGDHANIQYRIDGVILPEGISGFGQSFDTRFIKSINLMTGALPAQYGYRTAGVVEIETKTNYETGGRVDLYGGSRGTVQPSFEFGSSTGPLTYYLTGSTLGNNIGIENPTPGPNAVHDRTDQFKGFGYASYLLNPTTRLSVMFGSYDGFFQIPNRPRQAPNPQYLTALGITGVDSGTLNERQSETNRYGIVALQSSIGPDIDYQIAYFARDTSVRFTPDYVGDLAFNGVASKVYRSSIINGLQGDGSYRLNDAHTVRLGFFGSTENIVSDNTSSVFPVDSSGNVSGGPFNVRDNLVKNGNTLGGLYLQDEWKQCDKLTVNYGLRLDQMDAFVKAGQLSPRLGLVYKLTPDTTLHAAYAREFTPPPTELVSPKDLALFSGTSNAPPVNENSPVKPERAHYFDAGVTQKVASGLNVGLDGFYKIIRDLIDEGQFTEAPIFTPFNYSQGKIYGVELAGNYRSGNFAAYGNLARTVSLAKTVVSGQFNFAQNELDYITNHWVHTDHDQLYTASGGISYRWSGTLYSADATFGTGLRSGFVNDEHVASSTSVNLGARREFVLGALGPMEARLAIINVLDKINPIRSGTGIGVFAPQYGPRIGFFGGISKLF